ncbi:TPA: glucose 1-dehydrogenase [Klebsiella pneumoniae]|nr:glucose 1-dehydrogenase [Klebsiella pneumoniae]HDK6042834.1 glucose 1-dehydrogenase [Klebsiella pneumoniae]
MTRLQGKVALVTGAAQGIGAAIAEMFINEGAQVYITDLHRTSPAVSNRNLQYLQLNVSDEAAWRSVVNEVVETSGRIDVLINNAGTVSSYEGIDKTTTEGWENVMRVNSTGTFFGMREVIPIMRRCGGGSIVNLSSVWGSVGTVGVAAYQASKGAVSMLTKNGAITYAKDKIRVNSIHPGLIATPLALGQAEELNAETVRKTPLGRLGTPQEVAYGCVYLASDESSYVTGIELNIDGGYLAQ